MRYEAKGEELKDQRCRRMDRCFECGHMAELRLDTEGEYWFWVCTHCDNAQKAFPASGARAASLAEVEKAEREWRGLCHPNE